MINNVPKSILNAASVSKYYGNNFRYLGQYKGRSAWQYVFPENIDTGYPFVYLYADGHAEEITGTNALHIIESFVKD